MKTTSYSASVFVLIALALPALICGTSVAAPASVYPARAEGFTQSLNGNWLFKYIPALDAGIDANFYTPSFSVSAWKKIPVPANWELKGFAEPGYDLKDLKDGLGLYRRTFHIPAAWRGDRRVCLRFEGVAYGFKAWVNGKEVGESTASAYNPHTFDVTDALQSNPKADNILAVQVTTKPFAYEFDVNDDWSLSGICRDVTLFSVPMIYVQDVITRTKLTADGAADLSVAVTVSQSDCEVRAKLLAPNGKTVSEFALLQGANGRHEAVVHVEKPLLWTAETPALYSLQLSLLAKGHPLQTIEERIGLREVSIKDSVLLLNDRPIKLRGVDHHDMDPIDGRAITEKEMRRDLDLMKKENVNFIRTSHYPPQPRFIELCDELGFYVMDEVAIGRGEEHMNDPAYRENMMARTDATITRDKDHASVIVWSIGNENPVTDLLLEAGRRAKELDPSRPICYPTIGGYFEKNYQLFPEFVDIYAPHYPTTATLHSYAEKLKRPVILTEYAHALGLATDVIQDQWDVLQATPHFAGGAVWLFQDQGILRTSAKPVVDVSKRTDNVWIDATHFYDTSGFDGCDGTVYSDRTPQTDFWELRKVYAPIQIAERTATVKPGAQDISLTVENRYDFQSLAKMKLAWSLQRNGKEFQQGNVPLKAAAHERQTVAIPVKIPDDTTQDVLTLNVRCFDQTGLQINERTVRLDLAGAPCSAWIESLPAKDKPVVSQTDAEVKIALSQWTLTVERSTGTLTIRDAARRVLVSGIYPHCGHHLTMAERRNMRQSGLWPMSMLTNVATPEIKVTEEGSAVRLAVSGSYPRPDQPEQVFVGGYQAEIRSNGAISFTYDYAPAGAKGMVSEAGLSVVLPKGFTEFQWIGAGPFAGYPGKDWLNEFGIFHLNRDDLRYQGNRRETELALVTTPAGTGVSLTTKAADVAVERDGENTVLSHNAVISGLGSKFAPGEPNVNLEKTAHIAGGFTLLPLANTWPAALTHWFGKPSAARDVLHPFYHSYDQ